MLSPIEVIGPSILFLKLLAWEINLWTGVKCNDFVPLVKFMWKKRQEQPRRNVTFGKVADWNLRLFSMFFKFNKWYQIAQSTSYAKSFNHKHELLGYLNFVYVHIYFFKVKRRISEILAGLIWFNCFEMALVWTKNKRKAKAPYFSQIKTLCAWKILPCYARDKIFCLGLLSYRQFLVRKVYWHER